MKIIIWGYPMHTHTHSYTHDGFRRGFERLGHEVHWFHDDDYPEDFDFGNCLFFTEGYASSKIPLVDTSTYFVHCCVDPFKYIDAGCRIVDVRYNNSEINDVNYSYVTDRENYVRLDKCSYYQKDASSNQLATKWRKREETYEAVYMSWATHLMPEDINFEDMKIPRERKVHYLASISESNVNQINPFVRACRDSGIEFVHNNPWSNSLSWEEHKKLIQKSWINPDIRGVGLGDDNPDTGCNHLKTGYIPCRIFKNISYGQVGASNSKAVYDLFDEAIVYSSDTYDLFGHVEANMDNWDLIKFQMNEVKENHTFINRCQSLLKVYNKEV